MVRREAIDYACSRCGYVVEGPHAGEYVPNVTRMDEYKGAPISHGAEVRCPHCRRRMQEDTGAAELRALTVGSRDVQREEVAARAQVEQTPAYRLGDTRARRALLRHDAWARTMAALRKGSKQ